MSHDMRVSECYILWRVSECDMGFRMFHDSVQVDTYVYTNCVYPPSNQCGGCQNVT